VELFENEYSKLVKTEQAIKARIMMHKALNSSFALVALG